MADVEIHTFPIPHGMTWEQAFTESEILGGFEGYAWYKPRFWRMRWVNVRVARHPGGDIVELI